MFAYAAAQVVTVTAVLPVPGADRYCKVRSRKPLSVVGPAPCANEETVQQTNRNVGIRRFRMKAGRRKRRIRGNTRQQCVTGFLKRQTRWRFGLPPFEKYEKDGVTIWIGPNRLADKSLLSLASPFSIGGHPALALFFLVEIPAINCFCPCGARNHLADNE